jgi:hypothetical protein
MNENYYADQGAMDQSAFALDSVGRDYLRRLHGVRAHRVDCFRFYRTSPARRIK